LKSKHTEFLNSFIKNYSLINQSSVVHFSGILDKMLKVITNFKTACQVKREDKISFFKLLSKIEASISGNTFPRKSDEDKVALYYLNLIQGTKAFIELQLGIFNLNDSSNLKKIEHLTLHLRAKDPHHHDKDNAKYLIYIMNIVAKNLKSKNGEVFLSRVCEVNEGIDKKKFSSLLLNLDTKKIIGFSEKEKEFAFTKILNIVDCREDVKQKLIILLEN